MASEIDLNAGVLAPVADEIVTTDLAVDGRIPDDLRGVLARNGPNPYSGRFAGHEMLSWWIGSAMLHGIAFRDGGALWYRNRWVRTGQWDRHHDPSVAADPVRDQNTNVNIVAHAGRILALGEGGLPFAVTPELETIGAESFDGALPGGMTAHPKIDPESGELVFFRADWQAPYLRYGAIDRAGRPTAQQEIELDEPAMMHDFAITARHSLFLDLNVAYDFELLQHGVAIPLRWFDERRSRIGVIPRQGGDARWFEIAPCFIQHVVNAYDVDDTIVLEAIRYPDFLRFDAGAGSFTPNPLGVLWRYELDLDTGRAVETQIDDRPIELPRIDDRRCGRRNRYLYAVEQPSDVEMRGLVRYDREAGTHEHLAIPPGDQNSEPIFVPRDGSSREDDGWILCCVYRRASDTTDVFILDAAQLGAGPEAIVHLPRRIPAGFHGAWLDCEVD
jgi:carotenoid cleavage dioxygenase-like enzyme